MSAVVAAVEDAHDHLCPVALYAAVWRTASGAPPCRCALIAEVRADLRAKVDALPTDPVHPIVHRGCVKRSDVLALLTGGE